MGHLFINSTLTGHLTKDICTLCMVKCNRHQSLISELIHKQNTVIHVNANISKAGLHFQCALMQFENIK